MMQNARVTTFVSDLFREIQQGDKITPTTHIRVKWTYFLYKYFMQYAVLKHLNI